MNPSATVLSQAPEKPAQRRSVLNTERYCKQLNQAAGFYVGVAARAGDDQIAAQAAYLNFEE